MTPNERAAVDCLLQAMEKLCECLEQGGGLGYPYQRAVGLAARARELLVVDDATRDVA